MAAGAARLSGRAVAGLDVGALNAERIADAD
jgi:hypothetical protein